MSLSLFSAKTQYYKNGIWWFTKMAARVVGEDNWEAMRLFRRVHAMRFYQRRQEKLTEIYVHWPELANLIGIYPKVDFSHGFLTHKTYEMYRDFQENTLNSDGSFACYIYLAAGIYIIHLFYCYMLPFYGIQHRVKNEDMVRMRAQDALASTVNEEIWGNQFAEWGWTPHDFHFNRLRGMWGYMNVDDPRVIHITTFNRKHKYREHYMKRVGDQHHMTYPM